MGNMIMKGLELFEALLNKIIEIISLIGAYQLGKKTEQNLNLEAENKLLKVQRDAALNGDYSHDAVLKRMLEHKDS